MNLSKASFEAAGKMLGLEEWPGAKHNPAVLKMFAATGNDWVNDDETPWCAAFVGSVLASIGVQGTGKLNARSYLDWGDPVDIDDAIPGDVCVFWRGDKDGWQGHVAFYVKPDRGTIVVRGGNQGNKVSDKPYRADRLLAVRRAAQTPTKASGGAKNGGLWAIVMDILAKLFKGAKK
jgi:uncharacterized protein (TIGR02594 family)